MDSTLTYSDTPDDSDADVQSLAMESDVTPQEDRYGYIDASDEESGERLYYLADDNEPNIGLRFACLVDETERLRSLLQKTFTHAPDDMTALAFGTEPVEEGTAVVATASETEAAPPKPAIHRASITAFVFAVAFQRRQQYRMGGERLASVKRLMAADPNVIIQQTGPLPVLIHLGDTVLNAQLYQLPASFRASFARELASLAHATTCALNVLGAMHWVRFARAYRMDWAQLKTAVIQHSDGRFFRTREGNSYFTYAMGEEEQQCIVGQECC